MSKEKDISFDVKFICDSILDFSESATGKRAVFKLCKEIAKLDRVGLTVDEIKLICDTAAAIRVTDFIFERNSNL